MQEENRKQESKSQKNTKKIKCCGRLTKTVVFSLIIIFLIRELGEVLADKRMSYAIGNYYDFQYLYDLPSDSLDVAYVGTSQFHAGITPLEIWKEYGITGGSFNAANCRTWLAYYMIEEILKYQSPKVIVVDAATLRGDMNNIAMNRRIIGQFKMSPTKLKAMYNCLALEGDTIDEMVNTAFEFFAYHDNWDRLEKPDFTSDAFKLAYQKGYLLTTQTVPYSSMNHEEDQKVKVTQISERTADYIERIKSLCEAHEIKLMLTVLPSASWNQAYSEMVETWADENQIPFLDMTTNELLQDMDFDGELSFFDNNHMNYIGAEKTSRYLGKYLVENYQFEPKTQKIVEEWETDYEKYEAYRSTCIMKSTSDLSEFIGLANNPDYVICFSIKDDATRGLTQKELQKLKSIGIDTDFSQNYRGSMIAVVDNGTAVVQSFGQDAQSYVYQPYENLEIKLTSQGYEVGNQSSIQINSQEYSKNSRGINVVVYDKKSEEVICSKVFDTWLTEGER